MTKKMPILLTFDIDGETLWRSKGPEFAKLPVVLSQGRFGPEVGIPRILKALKKNDVKATFFIPGFTAQQYPDMVKTIDAAGHEIGNHGWFHTHPEHIEKYEDEEKEYVDAQNYLCELTGKTPKGFRAPAWEFSDYTIDIIEKLGFEYSSNMMDSESVEPLQFPDRKTNLVELPVNSILDDTTYWLFSLKTSTTMQPLDGGESNMKREFDALLSFFLEEMEEKGDSNICFLLTCHPQVTGHASRIRMLEGLIEYIKSHDQVQFMTCSEAVAWFKAK